MRKKALLWGAIALAALVLTPWYIEPVPGAVAGGWLSRLINPFASALSLGLTGRWWLLLALLPLLALIRIGEDFASARMLTIVGLGGLALVFLQGFLIGLNGWTLDAFAALFGGPGPKQGGMGVGGFLALAAFLMLTCLGLAGQGWCRGDVFVVAAIGWVVALIGLFVFLPVLTILASAFQDNAGHFAPALFWQKFTDSSIWGLGCLGGGTACGVAWNTVFLGVLVGLSSTALGLAFALIALRTRFAFKGSLKLLAILPIITPPFVIGLALILIFGRSGAVSSLLFQWFGIPPSRWIYGLPGVFIAQTLAFTPAAYLVMLGVVQGISPTLEEAAQTLRARPWTIFATLTWPLMRPGLANSFLLGFVESLADFGNPLVLGGNFEVLSTKIFFAVVGAATDQGRAAVLSLVLLGFTLAGFAVQQLWIGKKVYTTISGKGDAGLPLPLPKRVEWGCYLVAIPWGVFTIAVYLLIFYASMVKTIGRDYTFTLHHYITAFNIENGPGGLLFSGSAWPSFFATVKIALIAAPLTAAIGILTAYLLTRQTFAGKRAFEFGTLLSFAIPGTVVGVSYILAFNVPPIEITGTALILVICFIFRNMPVGVRAGIASLSQIDKSLDEASLTLGARSFTTLRQVILPLLKPAIIASLVYAFVRAMTAVSAVIFLVSAQYNMATIYIVGRVDAGEHGLAIAYSATLILVMGFAIWLINTVIGERKIGRRSAAPAAVPMAAG
ncbi:MAG TPA: iron ABC transporter permease [Beijerinckiaceae bacterium]|nr:iron ABC transporter permease [Beijerinckiaceae bacterium]